MDRITVRKSDVMDIVKENRARHRTIFTGAQIAFRERAIEELDHRLADARAGRKIDVYIHLPIPEDHTDDYDRVIRMLDLSIDEEITLSESDVKMYIQDDWSWRASFASNTASYLAQE